MVNYKCMFLNLNMGNVYVIIPYISYCIGVWFYHGTAIIVAVKLMY